MESNDHSGWVDNEYYNEILAGDFLIHTKRFFNSLSNQQIQAIHNLLGDYTPETLNEFFELTWHIYEQQLLNFLLVKLRLNYREFSLYYPSKRSKELLLSLPIDTFDTFFIPQSRS